MKDALTAFASMFSPPGGKSRGSVAVPSLTGAADAFLAAALADGRIVLAVAAGLPESDRLIADLKLVTEGSGIAGFYTEDRKILRFPPGIDHFDLLYFMRCSPSSCPRYSRQVLWQ